MPGPNEVLIKVHSAALNPSDVLFIKGKYKIKLTYPYTPGWEGSGTVVSVGPGLASSWLLGKRVAFMNNLSSVSTNEVAPLQITALLISSPAFLLRMTSPLNKPLLFT